MAEIHLLPIRPVDTAQLDRLHAEQTAAHQRKVDLGSRQALIRQIAETLIRSSQDFQREIDHQTFPVKELEPQFNAIAADLRNLFEKTAMLGALALQAR